MLAMLVVAPMSQGASEDTEADRVFGQADNFNTNDGGLGRSLMNSPWNVAVDGAGNLWVADGANGRVLEFDDPLHTDTEADRVLGQDGNFETNTPNLGGISATSLAGAVDVSFDAAGNLYVADQSNSRVLVFEDPLNDDEADFVFGQDDVFTTGAFRPAARNTLSRPIGVAVDDRGNVYIADGNNRVLEYDDPLHTDRLADRVFGQFGDFTTFEANKNGVSRDSLYFPYSVEVDGENRLYITDNSNNRVLVFEDPITTDTSADYVFGQGGDFTTRVDNKGGRSASSLYDVAATAVDHEGNVYIADASNYRVLEYDDPLHTDVVADMVFGQDGHFNTDSYGFDDPDRNTLAFVAGVAVDDEGNLYVSEFDTNRVLEYDNPLGLEPPPTMTPGPTPAKGLLGDVDCNDLVNAVDSLFILRFVAALGAVAECLQALGNVNCDTGINAVDALGIQRFVAGLPVNQQPGCRPIGT